MSAIGVQDCARDALFRWKVIRRASSKKKRKFVNIYIRTKTFISLLVGHRCSVRFRAITHVLWRHLEDFFPKRAAPQSYRSHIYFSYAFEIPEKSLGCYYEQWHGKVAWEGPVRVSHEPEFARLPRVPQKWIPFLPFQLVTSNYQQILRVCCNFITTIVILWASTRHSGLLQTSFRFRMRSFVVALLVNLPIDNVVVLRPAQKMQEPFIPILVLLFYLCLRLLSRNACVRSFSQNTTANAMLYSS